MTEHRIPSKQPAGKQSTETRNQTIGVRSQETSASPSAVSSGSNCSVEPSGVSNQQSAVEYLFSKLQTLNSKLLNEKGIALVMALIISLGIMVLVTGALYFTIQSTSISGAGKRYSTAEEAADGAVEIIKEGINSIQRAEPVPDIINDPSSCFLNATIINGNNCTTNITIPGTIGNYYTATTTLQNLFRVALPGSRIEFGRAAGATSAAIYYRIIVSVTDSTNTINAENSVLYRFTN